MQRPFGSSTKQRRAGVIAVLIASAMGLVWIASLSTSWAGGDWNRRLNDLFFKIRFQVKGPEPVLPTIGIVDVSDKTEVQLDMQPGDRTPFARLLSVLSGSGVRAVIFDIVFPEGGKTDGDEAFAQASSKIGVTYQPVVLFPAGYRSGLSAAETSDSPLNQSVWHPRVDGHGDPEVASGGFTSYTGLAESAKGIGQINAEPDSDGVYRRIPLLMKYRDGYVPNIALVAACDLLRVNPSRISVRFGSRLVLPDAHMPDGTIRDVDIPIDLQGRMILDFPGPWQDSFAHYSFATLLKAETDPVIAESVNTELDGMELIVSDVTTRSGDYGPTPFQAVYPLSGLHATVLNSILSNRFLRLAPWWQVLLANLAFGAGLWALWLFFRPAASSLLSVALWGLLAVFQYLLFADSGIMPQLVQPTVVLIFVLISMNGYRFLQAEREKLQLRISVQRYFSPHLVSRIADTGLRLMSAEQKTITILFSDIVSFTSWCTGQSPNHIRDVLNQYFAEMSQIVFRHEGTIDKFMGDGLMAFFGDPLEQPDHAVRAVHAAIQMQNAVKELRNRWMITGDLPIQVRIGINTGEAIVGDLGSNSIMAYTAIGSSVNLASRLEEKAPPGGILVSEAVFSEVKEHFKTRKRNRTTVKGIKGMINTFEILYDGESE